MIIEKNRLRTNGKHINRTTHVQFAQLVDCLKKHKQKMLDERPKRSDAAAFFAKELGFGITPATMVEAAEYAGVTWVPRGGNGGAAKYTVSRLKFLTFAVRKLYERLGEPIPAELLDE